MTDWTTLPNSSLETGKPIRAVDGRALRDNPIAIAEGSTGAPKIQPEALDLFYGEGYGSTNGAILLTVIDLDNVTAVLCDGAASASSGPEATWTARLGYQVSATNGASWGGVAYFSTAVSSDNTSVTVKNSTVVNMTSYNAIRLYLSSSGTSFGSGSASGSITGL